MHFWLGCWQMMGAVGCGMGMWLVGWRMIQSWFCLVGFGVEKREAMDGGGSAVWAVRVARGSWRDEGDQQTPSPYGPRATSRNEKRHGGLIGREDGRLFVDQSGSLIPVERICLMRGKVAELGKVKSKDVKKEWNPQFIQAFLGFQASALWGNSGLGHWRNREWTLPQVCGGKG